LRSGPGVGDLGAARKVEPMSEPLSTGLRAPKSSPCDGYSCAICRFRWLPARFIALIITDLLFWASSNWIRGIRRKGLIKQLEHPQAAIEIANFPLASARSGGRCGRSVIHGLRSPAWRPMLRSNACCSAQHLRLLESAPSVAHLQVLPAWIPSHRLPRRHYQSATRVSPERGKSALDSLFDS